MPVPMTDETLNEILERSEGSPRSYDIMRLVTALRALSDERDALQITNETQRKEIFRQTCYIDEITAVANKYGWNGVDNSKILTTFLEDRLALADALEKSTGDWEPSEFQNKQHDLMNAVQMGIVSELERAGFDPCPAIKIAAEATSKAWDIWGKFIAENEKLRKDTARIDDLEKRPGVGISVPENWTFGAWVIDDPQFVSDGGTRRSRASTLREAIDGLNKRPDLDDKP